MATRIQTGNSAMAREIKSIITRQGTDLIADMVGVIALAALLLGALHLPVLF